MEVKIIIEDKQVEKLVGTILKAISKKYFKYSNRECYWWEKLKKNKIKEKKVEDSWKKLIELERS